MRPDRRQRNRTARMGRTCAHANGVVYRDVLFFRPLRVAGNRNRPRDRRPRAVRGGGDGRPPRPHRWGEPDRQRHRHARARRRSAPGGGSRRGGGPRRRTRAAARAAGGPQGPHVDEGHPDDVRVPGVRALRARRRCADRRAAAGGGGDHHRQDQYPGVGSRIADVQRLVRRHAEPLRHDEDMRRKQRRRGGGAGHRHAPDRRRQRPGRLPAQSGRLLQRGRLPPLAGPGAGLAEPDRLVPHGCAGDPWRAT